MEMARKSIVRAKKYFNRFQKAAYLNFMVNAAQALGIGFASYYFQLQGLAFYKILLVWAIGPLASIPIVVLIGRWKTFTFLKLGVAAYIVATLSLLFYNPYSWLIFAITNGCVLGLFWVSFNDVFFQSSLKSQHAKDYSFYFIFPAIASIMLPPIGALIIGEAGYKLLFALTAALFLVPFFYIRGSTFKRTQHISFADANRAFSGIRLIVFLDNAIHFFQGHFLTIYVLLFLRTQYELGGLLSYMALLSFAVSLALSYVSDRYNKRTVLLYPLMTLMAGLVLFMPSLHSLAALAPVIGLYVILDNLSLPIRFAVHMDLGTKDIGFWRASEFYGNLGRTVIFGLSALFLYFGNYWLPFALFAAITLALPVVMQYKLKKADVQLWS